MDENFIYDGLYMVREYWEELGSNGFRVYKFRLVRMDDQSGNSWIKLKEVLNCLMRGFVFHCISVWLYFL